MHERGSFKGTGLFILAVGSGFRSDVCNLGKISPVIGGCPAPQAYFYRQHVARARAFSDVLLETLTFTWPWF